ncbi:MAG TPA: STAS domain-containing protein [Spirochaetota bacterium]|jgi:anti-sigma B factor antagonist|nr:STAS domain-containing protein [Spirochaetota bacterium]OPZ36828.1 MAG: putative anti-sigma factor antagonist [Spirochaetes bacterium ADurb.BinA120]HNU91731.1 STAS domain-containing protein [Spirochaetota bacterium]HPI15907.1 STAS domain-containing protein [Spirochaetota bacterium]HPO44830.1 STAS domain-containing protein [Spirochaetota bacterium]
MRIIPQLISDISILRIEGSLSNENLHDLEEVLRGLLENKRSVILDLFEVGFVCSSALSLFLSSTKKAQKENLHFVIAGLNEDIKKLFAVTELDRHLVLFDSVEKAAGHLEKGK